MDRDGQIGEGKIFRDVNEALMAYDTHVVNLQSKIKVRRTGIWNGEPIEDLIDTTVGKIIFNRPIPQDLGYVDRTKRENALKFEIDFLVGKKQLGKIIERCIKVHGTAMTSEVLDDIKAQGYKYSTLSAITVAVGDATIRRKRKRLSQKPKPRSMKSPMSSAMALLSDNERYNAVLKDLGKGDQRRNRCPAEGSGPLQPHLYDGRLRCSWYHEPDSSAGRYAWPDRQHLR